MSIVSKKERNKGSERDRDVGREREFILRN
jgi:hypothetical protein